MRVEASRPCLAGIKCPVNNELKGQSVLEERTTIHKRFVLSLIKHDADII